jgi:hypothetical protein
LQLPLWELAEVRGWVPEVGNGFDTRDCNLKKPYNSPSNWISLYDEKARSFNPNEESEVVVAVK